VYRGAWRLTVPPSSSWRCCASTPFQKTVANAGFTTLSPSNFGASKMMS
jgi:hypothetical protein